VKELEHFFCTYKQLQGKTCEIKSWEGTAKAKEAFERSRKLYNEKFAK